MSSEREIEPSVEILDAAICKIVTPTLEQIAAYSGKRIRLNLAVWRGESSIVNLPEIEAGTTGNPILSGKLKLRFRDVFGGRTLMHAEAIFDREQAVANCSGFSLKADLRDGAAKRTAFTMRYSVWDWTGWV